MMGNETLAEQERTAAQQLDPDEVRAAEVEFAGLSDSKDEAARRQLAQRVAKTHPKSATAWLLLAQSDASPELRSAALEHARQLAPEDPLVHWYSAWTALERGRAEQALEHSHRVLRRWPVTPNVLSLEVRALAANGGCDVASKIVWAARSTLTGNCSRGVTHEAIPCSRGPEEAEAEVCPRTRGTAASSAPAGWPAAGRRPRRASPAAD
jgi:predicted Zn-dependent protease